jgi:phosphoribosylformimino-5-aminoimidazole carboxamide ribotide isomerase
VELFPAIDLRQGSAVRLVQGDFARQHDFGDPLDMAWRFAAAGARWVHVVDLDAARTGTPVNRALVLEIARGCAMQVQAGGGVRGAPDVEELLGGGVARVVLGTAAGDPALVEELAVRFPGRVAVGLDHRHGGRDVAVWGWERASGVSVPDALARLAGVPLAAVVVTAIERDGAMAGPDIAGLADAVASTAHDVIASGGVRSVEDLRALGALEAGGRRLAGAVVGRALAEGTLSVEEAIAACAASG